MPSRSEAIAVLTEAIGEGFTAAEISKAFENHDIIPIVVNNELVGAGTVIGNEIHVAVKPEAKGRWFLKWVYKDIINPIVKEYGYAYTTVRQSNTDGIRFVERIGFRKVGEQPGVNQYVFSELH